MGSCDEAEVGDVVERMTLADLERPKPHYVTSRAGREKEVPAGRHQ